MAADTDEAGHLLFAEFKHLLQYAAFGFDTGKVHRCCECVDVQQIDMIDPSAFRLRSTPRSVSAPSRLVTFER